MIKAREINTSYPVLQSATADSQWKFTLSLFAYFLSLSLSTIIISLSLVQIYSIPFNLKLHLYTQQHDITSSSIKQLSGGAWRRQNSAVLSRYSMVNDWPIGVHMASMQLGFLWVQEQLHRYFPCVQTLVPAYFSKVLFSLLVPSLSQVILQAPNLWTYNLSERC